MPNDRANYLRKDGGFPPDGGIRTGGMAGIRPKRLLPGTGLIVSHEAGAT